MPKDLLHLTGLIAEKAMLNIKVGSHQCLVLDYFLLYLESQTSTGNFLSFSTLVSMEQLLLFP